MANLAILQPDVRTAARLRDALAGSHRIRECESWEEVAAILEEDAEGGCLVDLDHPDRASATDRAEELRASHPDAAIVAFVDEGRPAGFFHLGRLKLDGLVTATVSRLKVRAAVDQAFTKARAGRVGRAIEAKHGHLMAEVFTWTVEKATNETSVERMAAELSRSPSGLRQELHSLGGPGPARALLWGRLLLAGARLADDRRSAEEVSFALGYATSKSLARAMKHNTGHTVGEVADGGGLALVLNALLAEMDRGRAVAFRG